MSEPNNEPVSLGVAIVGDGLIDTGMVDSTLTELTITGHDGKAVVLHDVTLSDLRRLASSIRTSIELLSRLHKRGDSSNKLLEALRRKKGKPPATPVT